MNIYIPTRGRPHRQPLAQTFAAAGIPFTFVCSASDERLPEYTALGHPIVVVNSKNITEKRQLILDIGRQKLVMFDDDLSIFVRLEDGRFTKASTEDLQKLIAWFDVMLEHHAHAGLVDKFMSNARPRGVLYHGRYNQILGYNTAMFPPEVNFRMLCYEEHDMNLQLAAHGLPPAISCEFSKDAKYHTAGGNSHWRTPEVEKQQAEEFQQRWPHLVTLKPSARPGGVAATIKWKQSVRNIP